MRLAYCFAICPNSLALLVFRKSTSDMVVKLTQSAYALLQQHYCCWARPCALGDTGRLARAFFPQMTFLPHVWHLSAPCPRSANPVCLRITTTTLLFLGAALCSGILGDSRAPSPSNDLHSTCLAIFLRHGPVPPGKLSSRALNSATMPSFPSYVTRESSSPHPFTLICFILSISPS